MKKLEPERIKFLLNGSPINYFQDNPRQILSNLFAQIPNIEYWAPEAVKELILGSLQMMSDYANNVRKEPLDRQQTTQMSRFVTWANNIIKNLSGRKIVPFDEDYAHESVNIWDRAPRMVTDINERQILQKFFDIVLAGDGLAVIPGFYWGKTPDKKWNS